VCQIDYMDCTGCHQLNRVLTTADSRCESAANPTCSGEWIDGAGVPNQSADDNGMIAEPVYCPGGSAANVMKGIANLGGEAAFVGMVGKDEVGRPRCTSCIQIIHSLEASGYGYQPLRV
jgi:hypothetical protein